MTKQRESMFIPTIIDLEASGFGKGSYPIEVGFITANQDISCSLIKPAESWTSWNIEAEKVHGIKRELLNTKGISIYEIATWLNETFKGDVIYTDAWMNDMCWLGRLYDEAEISQTFKLESILKLLSDEERECWSQTHEIIINESNLKRHRASTDAKIIQETYLRLKSINIKI